MSMRLFLCGIAMSQPLPIKNVKILEIVELITLLITADDSDLGYFMDLHSNIAHAFNEKFLLFSDLEN